MKLRRFRQQKIAGTVLMGMALLGVACLCQMPGMCQGTASINITVQIARYSILGSVKTASGGAIQGVTVSTTGASATTDANGNYTLSGLVAGTYPVTPSKAEYTFDPVNKAVTVGPEQTGVNFTGTRNSYSISGTVTLSDTTDASGVKVEAGGKSVTTLADGKYTISGLVSGSYTVKASKAEYTFTDQNVTVGPDKTDVNFIGTRKPYSISGTVTLNDTTDASGVKVEASGKFVVTGADGKYKIEGLVSGTYPVKASKAEYTFTDQNVTLGPDKTGADFTGMRATYSISGTVTLGDTADASGVKVEAGGKSVTTQADGKYTLTGLVSGSYTVKASKAEYTFTDQNVTLGPDKTGVNFTGTRITYFTSGTVTLNDTNDASGVKVEAGGKSVTTGADGKYKIEGLVSGDYTVTPSKAEYTFDPVNKAVTVGPEQTGVNFTGTHITPDLMIKAGSEPDSAFAANDVYQSTPSGDQIEAQEVNPETAAACAVKVQNDGKVSRAFILKAEESLEAAWTISYKIGQTDISSQLRGSGYTTATLEPDASQTIVVEMKPGSDVIGGTGKHVLIKAYLDGSDTKVRDAVKAAATVTVVNQPDALIKSGSEPDSAYAVDNVYQATPSGEQIEVKSVNPDETAIYNVKVQNDGNTTRSFVVKATETTGTGWTLSYLKGTEDVTSDIRGASGYSTPPIAPGQNIVLQVNMTATASVTGGSTKTATLAVTGGGTDAVSAGTYLNVVTQPDALIKRSMDPDTEYQENDVYQPTPSGKQEETQTVPRSTVAVYNIKVENDGNTTRTFTVKAEQTAESGWTTAYRVGAEDVTVPILSASGWLTASLAPGANQVITVEMTPGRRVGNGTTKSSTLSVYLNSTDTVVKDSVKATTTASTNPAPTISSITPNSGLNNDAVSITNLAGTNFKSGAGVRLTRAGETPIAATSIVVSTSSKITCQFGLNGKTPGGWNVADTNPDGQEAVLTNGFTIVNADEVVHDVALTSFSASPTTVSRGQRVTFSYTVKNNGNATETNFTFRLTTYNGYPVGQTKTIASLGAGQPTSGTIKIKVPRRQKTGEYLITGEVPLLPDETNTANNSQTVKVTVK